MFKHELGSEVESKTTGFKGIIMARSECLYGCNRYSIQPKTGADGKMTDSYWFDEDDLKVINPPVEKKDTKKKTGGPISRHR